MKTEVYNLIILDESGSMSGITAQTISGCNETINVIKGAQEQMAQTQDHFVSIYAFQSGNREMPSRYLVKNIPALEAEHINRYVYKPWGGTPLLDALGSTLVDLKALVEKRPLAIGSVTVITDGYENSSTRYTYAKVTRLIDSLKEMGWNFNFIGANIDVDAVAGDLHIANAMSFDQTDEGTKEMFAKEQAARSNYHRRLSEVMNDIDLSMPVGCMPEEERRKEILKKMKEAEEDYFAE